MFDCSKLFQQADNLKDCGVIRDWIEPIRNHFWFCCEQANGDVAQLRVLIIITEHYSHVLCLHKTRMCTDFIINYLYSVD